MINPCDLTMSIVAIANAIAKNMSDDDLALTSAIFMQLADTLAVIATKRALCKNKQKSSTD